MDHWQPTNRSQIAGLTLAAIYIPFVFLFFSGPLAGNIKSVLSIWPFLPGVGLSAVTHVGGGSSVILTLLLLAASLYATLRFTRFFWIKIAGLMLASSGLAYVALLVLRS